jgi:hypothetical protein
VIAADGFPLWVYGGQPDKTTLAIPTGVLDSAIPRMH